MPREPSTRSGFGASLIDIMSAAETDRGSLESAARALDDLIESNNIPRSYEFFGTLCAALAYDIANEPYDARRMYQRLDKSDHPNLEHLVLSKSNSRSLTEAFGHIGLREHGPLAAGLSKVLSNLREQEEHLKKALDGGFRDDYMVLLATVALFNDLLGALENMDRGRISDINATASKISEDLKLFSPDPWIELTAVLCLQLIRRITERSILNLDIPEETKKALQRIKFTELWTPQKDAVDGGLLRGRSVVYSSPHGTGKSLLAYLAAGSLKAGTQMAYLVPTRSLSEQVCADLRNVLGPTREIAVSSKDRTDQDDRVSECDVVVATYEKMGALIGRRKIDPSRIRNVIADEIDVLGDRSRGLRAEMMLTRFLREPRTTQLIGISGMLRKADLDRLCAWMGAVGVSSSWKGTRVREGILLDGTLHCIEGDAEDIPMPVKDGATGREKKTAAAMHFAARAIAGSEAVLISVTGRGEASRLARDIAQHVRKPLLHNLDVADALSAKKRIHEAAADRIMEIEPMTPRFGLDLASMLECGIAYHHAGLPSRYREIVEDAVRDGAADVVVATPTLAAGMNFPIKTVLFFDAKYRDGRAWKTIENRQYRNIAGRAGRTGHHRTAEAIVIASTGEEFDEYRKAFWREPDPLRSPLRNVSDSGPAAAALRSQLLGYVAEHPGTDVRDILESLRGTWFWSQSRSEADKAGVARSVESSLDALAGYGLLSRDGGRLRATDAGRLVSESMLPPDSAGSIIAGLRRALAREPGAGGRTDAILVLAGLSADLWPYAGRAKGIKVPDGVQKAADDLFRADGMLLKPPERELAVRAASLLHYWINSSTDSEILAACGHDRHSVPPAGEEMARDAHRTLKHVASLAAQIRGAAAGAAAAGEIRRVADFCRIGSRDALAREILEAGLDHAGRDSAIMISRRVGRGRDMRSVSEDEIVSAFPDNPDAARLLFRDMRGARDVAPPAGTKAA